MKITQVLPLAEALRTYLHPLWEEYWAERPKEPLPTISSTHLCRESSHAAQHALEAAGVTGWTIVAGTVWFYDYEDIPLDVMRCDDEGEVDLGTESSPHTWLEHKELGLRLDLTADQFGQVDSIVLDSLEAGDDYEGLDDRADWTSDPFISETIEKWTSGSNFDALVSNLRTMFLAGPAADQKKDVSHG